MKRDYKLDSYLVFGRSEEEALFRNRGTLTEDVRERFLLSNMRFVIKMARKYRSSGLPFDDLVSEGTLGMIKAFEFYDPSKGARFITYASFWIQQSLMEYISRNSRAVSLPPSANTSFGKITRLMREKLQKKASKTDSEQTLNRLDLTELAKEADVPYPSLVHILNVLQPHTSMEKSVGDGDNPMTKVSDTLRGDKKDDPGEKAEKKFLHESLFESLAKLTEQERSIIEMRFALGKYGEEVLTLEEIGKKLGVSKERVRQIEAKILLKLKSMLETQKIDDFLE